MVYRKNNKKESTIFMQKYKESALNTDIFYINCTELL